MSAASNVVNKCYQYLLTFVMAVVVKASLSACDFCTKLNSLRDSSMAVMHMFSNRFTIMLCAYLITKHFTTNKKFERHRVTIKLHYTLYWLYIFVQRNPINVMKSVLLLSSVHLKVKLTLVSIFGSDYSSIKIIKVALRRNKIHMGSSVVADVRAEAKQLLTQSLSDWQGLT